MQSTGADRQLALARAAGGLPALVATMADAFAEPSWNEAAASPGSARAVG